MDVSEAMLLRQLEEEDARFKKMVAGLTLDNAMLKDMAKKLLTPALERSSMQYLQKEYDCSQRRACRALSVHRSSARHQAAMDKGAGLGALI